MDPTFPTAVKHNCIDDVSRAVSKNLLTEAFLPGHILVDSILAYLDLHSLVVFSGCSRICHNIVFDQTPKDRWEKIYLCGGKPCSINDNQLSAFLRNINAVEKTRVLSLVGCPLLSGRGIEVLAGSTVLEDIDLRTSGTLPLKGLQGKRYGISYLHCLFVTSVLRTMLPLTADQDIAPFTLRRVAFRHIVPRRNSSDNDAGIRFMSHLNSCKRMLAIQSITKQCNKQGDCFNTFGEKVFGKCSKCTETFCFTCKGQGFVKCSLCAELLCPACKEGQSIMCIVCNSSYCNSCAMPPKCSMCKVQKCQWCSNIYECGGCGKQSCANHGAECCSGCDTSYCSDCQDEHIEFCIVCNEHYCSDDCHERMHQ
jgi:hypothetical protein